MRFKIDFFFLFERPENTVGKTEQGGHDDPGVPHLNQLIFVLRHYQGKHSAFRRTRQKMWLLRSTHIFFSTI